ncbi:hypothetical protein DSM106972_080780 [Dulcicalothrix desertica PCC 7102]|uniref:DNA helicase n=1 Tax=Dulcicalothrix desertica PCC 7102 TaxID=232991 RepID=A0A3S1C1B4_9CYAN|nr:AAA domain-containing protein [Dulcicalothrix desertica]RUS98449.1 hypothetical protein DSM106972_080780 [Dulcicalothrix desertica PCC 7102]TWH49770.1 superfamily I DNA and/or RNA helicase [Dulcicalothrix desertica PCC 7102]
MKKLHFPKIRIELSNNACENLKKLDLLNSFKEHIGDVAHVFMSKLDGQDQKTGLPHLGMRIPMDYELGGLQFRIAVSSNYVVALSATRWTGAKQRWEVEMTCHLSTDDLTANSIPKDWIETLLSLSTREQAQDDLNKRLKNSEVYLDVCEQSILNKMFQVPFVSYQVDRDNPKCLHLTLAPVISADILKTIKQCRRDDSINLYTISPLQKYKVISTVSSLLKFKTFYQQHYQSNSFFLLTGETGAIIGYLPPDIIEKQSELQTSEKLLITQRQEIVYTDFNKISVKFQSLNQQTRILKVLLSEKHIEINPLPGIIVNSLIRELNQIHIQKDAIKRLKENRAYIANLDIIIFGRNEELQLPAISTQKPIPVNKCLNKDKLNELQKLAIAQAQASPDIFALQGPPGAGKSTSISELGYQIVLLDGKVLIVSQSNLAVDNALLKFPIRPDLLIIRIGNSEKVSKDAQELLGKKAVIRWLKSCIEECQLSLLELQEKAKLLDLFINNWEDISKWLYWQQEKAALLADAVRKKALADEYTKQLIELKERKLMCQDQEKSLKALIKLPSNQVIEDYTNELWQPLALVEISAYNNIWTNVDSNTLEIAIQLQEQLLRNKPGGNIFQFKQDCNSLCQTIASIILEIQGSIQIQKDIKKSVENIGKDMEEQQSIEEKLKHVLDHGITTESSEVVSLSPTYTSISRTLSEVTKLIKQKNSIKNTNFIKLFLDASSILRHKINFVQLIRSWSEAEINVLPNQINQYKYLYNKFLHLKILSSLPIIGRLFKPTLDRAEEQLKSSIENISNASRLFHTQSSKKAKQIYDEYNSQLQVIEVKVIELYTQHQQEIKNLEDEEYYYSTLFTEDAQSLLDKAKALLQVFNDMFQYSSKRITLKIEDSLNIENLTRVNITIDFMANFTEHYIRVFESEIIPSFKDALVSMYNSTLSLKNEHALDEQSVSKKANPLNQEYNDIITHIERQDNKYQLGNRLWEKLRTQKAVQALFDTPISKYDLLNMEREDWIISVGGETGAKTLTTKIKIKQDWIARISTNDIEISDETYELFLKHANIVGATCMQTGKKTFLKHFPKFDAVIIDEASKATKIELLISCLLGYKIIFVGDHKQLPPIVKEESWFIEAAQTLRVNAAELQKKLTTSLFKERYEYLDSINANRTLMLINQYRMHSQIMEAVNQFYGNKLTLGCTKQDKERAHGIKISNLITSENHLMWIDLPHNNSDWYHQQVETGRQNPREAELIIEIIQKMKKSFTYKRNLSKKIEIGIISVYKAQTDLIKSLSQKNLDLPLNVTLTIGTVDEFQGMEKDIMFVSLVLNKPGVLPSDFLQTPERINVAMSRAKNLLIITGSSYNYTELESEASPIYKHILDTAKKYQGHLLANEFMD